MENEQRVLAAAKSYGEAHLADPIEDIGIDVQPIPGTHGRMHWAVRLEIARRAYFVLIRVEPTGAIHAQSYTP